MEGGVFMQSVAKRSEASNIYKLSDLMHGDEEANSEVSGEIAKKPASTLSSNKDHEGGGDGKPRGEPSDQRGEAGDPAPSDADDALAWLKIIQRATTDLTADLRTPQSDDDIACPLAEDALQRKPAPSAYGASERRSASFQHHDESDERKLAAKLAFRKAEPRQAAPHSLRAALLPYLAATGVLAFLAGCAAVYFLTGPSAVDVKARTASPAAETQLEAPLLGPAQSGAKKGAVQKAVTPAVSVENANPWGISGEQAAKPASPADHQSWSDTVETFKQFVRP